MVYDASNMHCLTSPKKLDHVVLSYQSCGHCRSCKSGRPARCLHFKDLNFGFMRPDGTNTLSQSGVLGSFFGQSAFANYVLATERNCVKVPRKYRIEELAPLGCGLQEPNRLFRSIENPCS